MIKPDRTVIKETKYIVYFSLVLSIIMQVVFIILKMWDISVLLGNILSTLLMSGNFFFMGLAVQKAVATGDEKEAKKIMKNSLSLRTCVMFIVVVAGVVLSVFSTIAVIIPLFFTRIAVAFRPLWKDEKQAKEVYADNESE